MKKKNTKAGISSVSASEWQRSFTIKETRSRFADSARATNCAMLSGP